MLALFGWNVGMSGFAVIVLIAGAVVLGAVPLFIGSARTGYEWLFSSVGVLVGGWLGSEAFGGLSTFGPAYDGLYLLPALVGGVILGGLVDIAVRYVNAGSYAAASRPI